MTTFDDRERESEKRWEHDEELRFKATARRNKLLGLWAAELLGLHGDKAEAYAKEVVIADFEKPGPDDVVEKLVRDFERNKIEVAEHTIRAELDRQMQVARDQIMSE